MMSASYLLNSSLVHEKVREWLREDIPSFDYGGYVVGNSVESAVLLCKSPGILAGVPFFDGVFTELGCSVEWLREEGEYLEPVTKVAIVEGEVRKILQGERLALNCLSRASGVATISKKLKEKATSTGWKGQIAGTRKTTPGFRLVEKYALLVAGIDTHRYDLSSMIMLKDNHIWAAGNITKAVKKARNVGGFSNKIEVECRSVTEALEAAGAGADVVMLDNFEPQALHKAAEEVKKKFPQVLVESSGGVTVENITKLTGPCVDIISSSKTTQGYSVVDFSLKIQKEGHNPENPLVTMS